MAKTIPDEEKVFMVSKSTNTTYSGSASLKAMQEWYTMEDVANTVKPYKVFTALLTQSGGDNALPISEGTLTIGVTYMIASSFTGDDFSNVGGPKITFGDEGIGTYFIATGTTPANWTNETEFEYNTGAPVVNVLENTIGNIWFTYDTPGLYLMRSNGLFTENKTFYQNVFINAAPAFIVFNTSPTTNEIGATDGDGTIYNIPIEFRVYN